MLDIIFSYGWEPVSIHQIRMKKSWFNIFYLFSCEKFSMAYNWFGNIHDSAFEVSLFIIILCIVATWQLWFVRMSATWRHLSQESNHYKPGSEGTLCCKLLHWNLKCYNLVILFVGSKSFLLLDNLNIFKKF